MNHGLKEIARDFMEEIDVFHLISQYKIINHAFFL
jgi:hypothetical protein